MDSIFKQICEKKHIVIYGAGKYASCFYTYLQINKLEDKVMCFTVTNHAKADVLEKSGKRICTFSEIAHKLKESLIIIAMAEKTGIIVQNDLKNQGIENFVQLTIEHMEEINQRIYEYFKNIPIQRNKIFVECFQNKGYRCNCKYIAQELLEKKKSVDIVWVVSEDSECDVPSEIRTVKEYSYDFYKEFYTSGIRVGNMAPRGGLVNRKEQYYINTWHGSGPFKKVGISANFVNEAIRLQVKRYQQVDLFVSNTGDNTQMMRESFLYQGEIYECGSPRNDIFFQVNNLKEEIYNKYKIDKDKKVVLYAPTYREGKSFQAYDLDFERVIKALESRFGDSFVLLYRFHYLLNQSEESKNFYPKGINVTEYSDMQELLVASDILITDYSSIMWDFSLQDKPIFLYQNDADYYEEEDRGFYCPVREWPYIKAHSTDEMVDAILEFDEERYLQELHAFIDKYQSFDDGHASERVVERIMDVINHPKKYGKE